MEGGSSKGKVGIADILAHIYIYNIRPHVLLHFCMHLLFENIVISKEPNNTPKNPTKTTFLLYYRSPK